jgi:Tfp pilus assembly protein PilO
MDNKKIDLLAAGIIIVLFVFAYFAFFKGGWANAADLKEKEKMLLESLDSAADTNLELDRIAEEIDFIQKNLENFDRQLPEEKRIYDFLVEIDKLAKDNSVNLKAIRPGRLEEGTLYSRVPINISGNSRFKDFYKFLFQLENIPRITMTEQLRVKSLPEGNRCDIEMDVSVFVGGN